MRPAAALLALLAAAACSEAPPEPSSVTVAVPTPAPPAAPPVAAPPPGPGDLPAPELDAARPAIGSWRFQASASGAAARFGSGGDAVFAITCEPQTRELVLARAGRSGTRLRIVARNAAAGYPAQPRDDGIALVEARIPTDDSFLTALAQARGAMAVMIDDGVALAIPADPAVCQVVESCRR